MTDTTPPDPLSATDVALANAASIRVLCWALASRGIIAGAELAEFLKTGGQGLGDRPQAADLVNQLAAAVAKVGPRS